MEAPEYFSAGYYQVSPQYITTPEKKVVGGGGGGDHFVVEDLLDFSNEEEDDAVLTDGGGAFDAAAGGDNSTDSSTVTAVDSASNSFSGPESHHLSAGPDLAGADLFEPYDPELEWLSSFAEESLSGEDFERLQLISGLKAPSAAASETRSVAAAGGSPPPPAAQFRPEGPVPGKARSKRSRAAPCNWSSRLLVLSQAPSAVSPESELLVPTSPTPVRKAPPPPPHAASKKKDQSAGPMLAPSDGRRCLHCATDKTPQWRTGPMGPKTLCNACGVRYKSGRLVPEYRPAASPTFVLSKHSNSHRKVMELRRQKEMMDHHGHHHPPHHHHHHHQQQFIHSAVFDGTGQQLGTDDDFLIHHHIGPDYRQLI